MQLLQALQQALTTLQSRADTPLSTEAANALRQLLTNLLPVATSPSTAVTPSASQLPVATPITATVLQIQNQQVLLQLAGQQFTLPINQLPLAAQTQIGTSLWLQILPATVPGGATIQFTQLAAAATQSPSQPPLTMPAQLLPETATSPPKLSIAGTQINLPPKVAESLTAALAGQSSRALAMQVQVLPPPPAQPNAAPQLQWQALKPTQLGAQAPQPALATWQQPLLNLPRTLLAKLPLVMQKSLPLPNIASATSATATQSSVHSSVHSAPAGAAAAPTVSSPPTAAAAAAAESAVRPTPSLNAINALLPLRANMLTPVELLQRLPLLQQQLVAQPQATTAATGTSPAAAPNAPGAAPTTPSESVDRSMARLDNGADILRALLQQLVTNIQPTQPQQLEQAMNQWFAARPLSLNPSQSLGGLGQLLLVLLGAKLAQTTASASTAQTAAQWSQNFGSQLAQQLAAGLPARTPGATNTAPANVATPSATLLSGLAPQLLQNLIQTIAGSMNTARMSQAQLTETARAGMPDYHLLVPMHGQQPYQQAELLVQRRKQKRRRGELEEDIWLFKLRMPLARYGPVLVKGSYQHQHTKIQFVTESVGARVHIQEHLKMLDARFKALQLTHIELSAIRGKVPEQLQELSGSSIHLQV